MSRKTEKLSRESYFVTNSISSLKQVNSRDLIINRNSLRSNYITIVCRSFNVEVIVLVLVNQVLFQLHYFEKLNVTTTSFQRTSSKLVVQKVRKEDK